MKRSYLHFIVKVSFIHFAIVLFSCDFQSNNTSEMKRSNFENSLNALKNQDEFSNQILVTAHRGDWRNAPENSLLAMKFSIEKGVDIMETDLKMTRDSILILMHDKTLDRTTTGKGYVKDWTLDSIQRSITLRNGYGEPTPYNVPTLEEALLFAKGKIIIDLDKSYPYIKEAYNIAKKTNTLDQVIFRVNDNWEVFNSKYKDFIDEIHYMPLVWWNTENPSKFISDYINAPKPPVAIEVIYKKEDSQQFLAYKGFNDFNCRIMMNTIFSRICAGHNDFKALNDPEANWGWVIENGANIIGTDRPVLLLNYLRSEGLHN